MEQLQEQLKKITEILDELKSEIGKLRNSTTIPHDVDQAFRARFRLNEYVQFQPSLKTANSETQIVDVTGATPTAYPLLTQPDGWEQRVVNGVLRYYPFWL